MKQQKSLPLLQILLASALWGFVGVFVHLFTEMGFSSMQIIAIRCVVGSLVLCLVCLVKGKALFRIALKDIWMFIGTGIISFTLFNYCYFQAIEETSLAVAAVLLYTAPIFVTILSAILFGEKFTLIKAISLVVTFAGCLFITGIIGGGSLGAVSTKGILLGIASGFTYGLYSIFSNVAVKKYDNMTVSTYTFLFSTLAAIPFAGFSSSTLSMLFTGKALVHALLLGIFICAIPYTLYNNALTKMETSKAAIISTLEPVVAAFVSFLFLGEQLTLQKIVGIVLIIGAVILLNLPPKRPAK